MIFIMHFMNFYQRFRADDVLWDFGPLSDRYEFTFYTDIDLSMSPLVLLTHHSLSLFLMYSNFFLKPTAEFPLI